MNKNPLPNTIPAIRIPKKGKTRVNKILAAEMNIAAELLHQSVRITAEKLGLTQKVFDSMLRAKSSIPPEVLSGLIALLGKTSKEAKDFIKYSSGATALEVRNTLNLTDAEGAELSGLLDVYKKKHPEIDEAEAKKLAAARFRYAIQSRSSKNADELSVFVSKAMSQLERRATLMKKSIGSLQHFLSQPD